MEKIKLLTSETLGKWISEINFPDITNQVWHEGRYYFTRPGEDGATDFIIVFQDIDDFAESTDSQMIIDFQRHKEQMYLMVWTLTEAENPLGFPFAFNTSDPEELKKLEQIIAQDKVWIHYLAVEEDQLIHIFSEAYELPESDRNIELMYEKLEAEEEEQEVDEIEEKEANELTDEQLLQMGFAYALDYSTLCIRLGEEEAQEYVMSAVFQAMTMVKNHPQQHLRMSNFLIWVSQTNEETTEGEDSRLLTIYISSEHQELYHLWTSTQDEADPFAATLFTFPEFLTTMRALPIEHGSYPIMEYEAGVVRSIGLDQSIRERMASLWKGEKKVNPYLDKI